MSQLNFRYHVFCTLCYWNFKLIWFYWRCPNYVQNKTENYLYFFAGKQHVTEHLIITLINSVTENNTFSIRTPKLDVWKRLQFYRRIYIKNAYCVHEYKINNFSIFIKLMKLLISTCKSCFKIQFKNKWLLTGTWSIDETRTVDWLIYNSFSDCSISWFISILIITLKTYLINIITCIVGTYFPKYSPTWNGYILAFLVFKWNFINASHDTVMVEEIETSNLETSRKSKF